MIVSQRLFETLKEQFPNLSNKVDERKSTEVIKNFISNNEDEQ